MREEFSLQGMTGVNAWDGKSGWKIEPWNGKKDPEALGEEEQKSIIEDADFDGPLVNYKAKGNKVEYLCMDPVEGTDAYKLKVTLANGETRIFYMDTDYYVPIKIEGKRIVRGTEFSAVSTGDAADIADNLRQIREARRQADWVVVSFHSHDFAHSSLVGARTRIDLQEPADFIPAFAHVR